MSPEEAEGVASSKIKAERGVERPRIMTGQQPELLLEEARGLSMKDGNSRPVMVV